MGYRYSTTWLHWMTRSSCLRRERVARAETAHWQEHLCQSFHDVRRILNISIGAECMIGPYCYITDHDHGAGDGPISAQALVEAPVNVGNNVWIGAHAVILKGVSIGDNAIVGAGAVVTTDVGPGERVAGVPARQIGSGKQVGGEPYSAGWPAAATGLRGALSVDATGIDRGRESACRRRHPHLDRGSAVVSVLKKVLACDPQPAEIWVHIDQNDGVLERHLMERFPGIHSLTSAGRLGPGGGRHRCLLACGAPYAVSLDDNSWPVDADFFAAIEPLFSSYPSAAIFGASIWHRAEAEIAGAVSFAGSRATSDAATPCVWRRIGSCAGYIEQGQWPTESRKATSDCNFLCMAGRCSRPKSFASITTPIEAIMMRRR